MITFQQMDTGAKFKGRGAGINTANSYLKQEYVREHPEGIDEPCLEDTRTEYLPEYPKQLINKVKSPDIGHCYSMNPFQGCEHGCIYCYARNTHQYYGYSAGLDFERKIIVKQNAPEVLERQLQKPGWEPLPLMLAGNTDCYQPVERKVEITRRLLQVLAKYRHPVSLITKNRLILRDLDLLKDLAQDGLVRVSLSITTLNEELRRKLEPRTAAYQQRLKVVSTLSEAGIPVNVMVAPIIPALNSHEIPALIKAAADHGAVNAGYTLVRLNGSIGDIFREWVYREYPDRAEKVLHQIEDCHGGQLNDSRYGKRMRGEGKVAESIAGLFRVACAQYLKGRSLPPLNLEAFRNGHGKQTSLF